MTRNKKELPATGLFSGDRDAAALSPLWITAYCDGGSRGNPGPSGFGVFLQNESGQLIGELSEFLGRRTNNYAEYSGLLAALNFALDEGHPRLRVVSDSELMVKQIKGQYRVNSPELRPLYEEAKRRIARLEEFRIEHVLRGKNQQADRLANLAMDRGASRGPGPSFRAAVKAVAEASASAGSAAPGTPGPLPDFPKAGIVKPPGLVEET